MRLSRQSPALVGLVFVAHMVWADTEAIGLAKMLFAPNEVAGISLSPGGERVAILKNVDERQALYVGSPGGKSESLNVFDTRMIRTPDTVISGMEWIDDTNLVIGIREWREAIAGLEDTRRVGRVIVVRLKGGAGERTKPEIYELKTPGWVVSPLAQEENVFLFARSRSVSKVYRIDVRKLAKFGTRPGKTDKIDGGQFISRNEVARVDGYVFRWLPDSRSRLLGAIAYTDRNEVTLWTRSRQDKEWRALKTWSDEDSGSKEEQDDESAESEESDDSEGKPLYIPIALTGIDGVFYALGRGEDVQPGVYKYNYGNDEAELVFAGPESDIISPLLSSRTHELIGVSVVDSGRLKYEYFQESVTLASGKAAERFSGSTVSLAASDLSGDKSILYVRSFQNPGDFYLSTTANDSLTHLAAVKPSVDGLKPTKLTSGTVENQGLQVEYFLTRPVKNNGEYPLIVMPHGGPVGIMDYPGFNPAVQYFAQSGYAVLRVNYRGSAGYSEEFLKAGKKAYGTGMLADIEAAIDEVVKGDVVDGSRICIVGASYGGYAALMLPVRRPDAYRCTAALAAVTDLNLIVSSEDKPFHVREWFKEYVGDSGEDYEKLKSISPVYSVEALKRPLYLAHGADDRVVDPEHSYRLKRMLDALGRDYQWRIFEDQGHSFDDHRLTQEYFRSVRDFIQEHI